ncbi:MAG: type IV secretory system conjugative DNA transfer family protein, partial [Patescibacteria group bacterium]
QTGTGKSVFMENLALQDMLEGRGFCFVDPHGDAAERLLSMVPKERTEDVIYFSPADMDFPLGLNLFEFQTPDQRDFLIQEAINMLYKLYDPGRTGIIGPRYEHIFRNAALTVMAGPEGGTFVDIPKLFRDTAYVEQKLQHVTDQNVIDFWRKEIPQSQRSNEYGEVTSWFVSKFGAFLSNEMMRNIIGQTKSAFNLRDIMDGGKILLVNLSRGRTGDLNSKLLGMIFVMKFEVAAMSRADVPEDYRRDFSLYVDEFQNFATDSFATILSEARKYRLNLVMINQYINQMPETVANAVFGNVGTMISFRVGASDAEVLRKEYEPIFEVNDLVNLPNRQIYIKMAIDGVTVPAFSAGTLPPPEEKSNLKDAVVAASRASYSTPRTDVEDYIAEWSMPINLSEEDGTGKSGGARRKDETDRIVTSPTAKEEPQRFVQPAGDSDTKPKDQDGEKLKETLKNNKIEIIKDRFDRQWYGVTPIERTLEDGGVAKKDEIAPEQKTETISPPAALSEKVIEKYNMETPQSGGDRGEKTDETQLISWEQADQLGLKLPNKDVARPTNYDDFEPIDEL